MSSCYKNVEQSIRRSVEPNFPSIVVTQKEPGCRQKKSTGSICRTVCSPIVKSEKEIKCTNKVCEDSLIKKRAKCFDQPPTSKVEPCAKLYVWQRGRYTRDDCGSGIMPNKMNFRKSQKVWCKTPLSMYQATIGELGRQLLCGETRVVKDIKDGPPCNVCEYVLPLCRGYYRKYDCIKPCEDEYATRVNGKLVYRDPVQRYWHPCLSAEEKSKNTIRAHAPHNAYLGEKLRRAFDARNPCW